MKRRPAESIRREDDDGPIKASSAGPLLKALHIMNADGSISADMRRKFKQVNHLVTLFAPVLEEITSGSHDAVVIDANCGNSYVAFLLDHFVTKVLGRRIRFHGIDASAERVATCEARARALGAGNMSFETVRVGEAAVDGRADLLISLHGCDTATDEAILLGVRSRIRHIQVVPCCQREVRPMISPESALAPFLHDGIIARDLGADLTDVLRSLFLRIAGYRAETIEFVPLEHSLKNRLIRGKYTRRQDEVAREQCERLLGMLKGTPRLFRRDVPSPSD